MVFVLPAHGCFDDLPRVRGNHSNLLVNGLAIGCVAARRKDQQVPITALRRDNRGLALYNGKLFVDLLAKFIKNCLFHRYPLTRFLRKAGTSRFVDITVG